MERPSAYHDCDRAALTIEVGDGEWNALGSVLQPDHHELPGLGGLGHVGRIDLPQECQRGQ